jgi:EAL domain-containing protein (putative c-di-GMP-specific phosphodiesterase class I)
LAVHYQVLVDEKGSPVGAEALRRWHCPGRGMVSPAEFIPLAEETGLIESIGYWVLEEVLSRVASWKKRGDALAKLQVSVNVSARQFHLPSFCSTVMALLRKTGASPRNLKVEITESALASALKLSAVAEGVETRGQLERLVRMGCTRFQGYYFSRPLPALEFEGLIEKSRMRQQRRAW